MWNKQTFSASTEGRDLDANKRDCDGKSTIGKFSYGATIQSVELTYQPETNKLLDELGNILPCKYSEGRCASTS